jgi:hypothetical protein
MPHAVLTGTRCSSATSAAPICAPRSVERARPRRPPLSLAS